MTHGAFQTPTPVNEPVREYRPGSPERSSLEVALAECAGASADVPLIIDGNEVRTDATGTMVMPHDHGHVLGTYHKAGAAEVAAAIEAAETARAGWASLPWEERAAVFLRAAELLAGPWRDRINASTMLNQSKTVHQAEIDAACELIDFFRFNVHFLRQLYQSQPESSPGCWNRIEHRCLDGFVFAITPFNFTSIAGNLPTAPAMLGNTVLWKPASTSVLSNYLLMEMLAEAGLPPGVINFVPGSGAEVGDPVIADARLAGVHFTGSTEVFQGIWGRVGANIRSYGQYPRLVGETGGKDFIFAHPSADVAALATAVIRGAFEFQGQKCSAASRAYVPASLWGELAERLGTELAGVRMGDVRDFGNFMGAVIDASSFAKLGAAVDLARNDDGCEIVAGGERDDSTGWFVQPTVVRVDDPRHELMRTEYFGPLIAVHVYDDERVDDALELCATGSEYGLTGAVFADDRAAVAHASERLRFAAGNFYVNDKPTGAVVGQQPFGGSRASGTNDKAGSILNLLRWSSQRTIKETFVPPRDWRYPFLEGN
ncbi:MAG: L-glutamate gamma-semialdehyde dehydrogenase [Planctomycetota bacterium]|jgi:1-pyrroline-5-carboxylate dehydrogenase|nr:L-glutamate gamma-semialdehyde dehydrogenase [Planctomycetota bacterium]MDP6764333.1 L-glutamate gamma-semialdehyde dehydrogenase [Planctomycetota bacterium]MDP6988707.1 L-glutamate gamma-semialdehyde dehydrogenase [Planctomycetota bacterium]